MMVSKTFVTRIEQSAEFLQTPLALQVEPWLDPSLRTALSVLAVFNDGKPHTYRDIAERLDLHIRTVQQVIWALERGGYPLQTVPAVKTQPNGRPPVLYQLP